MPVMTYDNLARLVGSRYCKKIAHNTTATLERATVDGGIIQFYEIEYHGNLIARVMPHGVQLSTAGWATQTTLTRLRAILNDVLPGFKFDVRVKDGGAVVVLRNARNKVVREFRDAVFYDPAILDEWEISGRPIYKDELQAIA